jgi:translation initiation factor 2 subunit 1
MQEGDLAMCTVEKIVGTTIFVKIAGNGEATIVTSEIAPGRIRNLREYVVPGKRIVCKVIGAEPENIRLSLRRVTSKEKNEIFDKYEKERSSLSILKSIIKEKAEEVANKIKEKEPFINDFFVKASLSPELLKPYLNKDEADKLLAILKEKKEREVSVKHEFALSSDSPNGITIVKSVLNPYQKGITYLAAGRYLLSVSANDYKKANHEILRILGEIEKKAKEQKLKFESKNK